MNIITFITFCIEHYAKHTGKTGDVVYQLLKREKLIELLENDYDDLHGMGTEYLMQFIDEYLDNEFSKQYYNNQSNDHSNIRSIIIPEIVNMILEKYHITEIEALDIFYTSATGGSFADDETGLYGQSALFVFGLFCEEQEGI